MTIMLQESQSFFSSGECEKTWVYCQHMTLSTTGAFAYDHHHDVVIRIGKGL